MISRCLFPDLEIEKIEKHPDAEKLVICQIDAGVGRDLQIVTGAQNVFEGAYIPVAKVGAKLVGGFKISVAGSKAIYEYLKQAYTMQGLRAFDVEFMSGVYEKPFEVEWLEEDQCPYDTENIEYGMRHSRSFRLCVSD